MKKLTLLILIVFFVACKPTPQQKAEALVKKYLDTSLNDPKSYESVSFGELTKLNDTLYTNGKIDTSIHLLELKHTYRAKNQFGAFIKVTKWFEMDNALKDCFMQDFSYKEMDRKLDIANMDGTSKVTIDTNVKKDSIIKVLHR